MFLIFWHRALRSHRGAIVCLFSALIFSRTGRLPLPSAPKQGCVCVFRKFIWSIIFRKYTKCECSDCCRIALVLASSRKQSPEKRSQPCVESKRSLRHFISYYNSRAAVYSGTPNYARADKKKKKQCVPREQMRKAWVSRVCSSRYIFFIKDRRHPCGGSPCSGHNIYKYIYTKKTLVSIHAEPL